MEIVNKRLNEIEPYEKIRERMTRLFSTLPRASGSLASKFRLSLTETA